jgi:hypothetical protein
MTQEGETNMGRRAEDATTAGPGRMRARPTPWVLVAVMAALLVAPAGAAAKTHFVTWWGGYGYADGRFHSAGPVATGVNGRVYVDDWDRFYGHGNRLEVFSTNGRFLDKWGRWGWGGTGGGDYVYIAADPQGRIYVGETDFSGANTRIQKYTAGGRFLTQWKTAVDGTDPNNDQQITGIATDPHSNVYVTHCAPVGGSDRRVRVQKFSPNGMLLRSWGRVGDGNAQFNCPTGIATDAAGHVYVGDLGGYPNYGRANQIKKFTATGRFLNKWRAPYLRDIATDPQGRVLATMGDPNDGCCDNIVRRFSPSGQPVERWGAPPDTQGWDPNWLETDASGNVFVTGVRWPKNDRPKQPAVFKFSP